MKEWVYDNKKYVCVGYSSGEMYTIYDAEADKVMELDAPIVKAMVDNIINLELTPRMALKCPYINKRKLSYFGLVVVGIVYDTVVSGQVVGYDAISNTGSKFFVDKDKADEQAWCGTIRNMVLHYMGGRISFRPGGSPLYTRYAEDDWTDEDRQKELSKLKEELIEVLMKLDRVKPVQFHSIGRNNCVYNFSDVVMDIKNNRVFIEISDNHDNLPTHEDNPLVDGYTKEE